MHKTNSYTLSLRLPTFSIHVAAASIQVATLLQDWDYLLPGVLDKHCILSIVAVVMNGCSDA